MRTLKGSFLIFFLALLAARVQAATTIYYEVNPSGVGAIMKYNGTSTTTFSTGFQFPEGLVQDTSGNFYWLDQDNGKIMKVGSAGGTATIIASTAISPYGMAINSAGNLFVSNFVNDSIAEYTPSGSQVTSSFTTSFPVQPYGLAFDTSGNLYVANGGTASVTKYNTSGVLQATYTLSGQPQGLAFDASGNLYVAVDNTSNQATGGSIEKFSSTGTDLGAFATGLQQPTDMAFAVRAISI